VVEIASPSDEGPRGLTAMRQKMATYQRNGTRLGWLLIQRSGPWKSVSRWRIHRRRCSSSKRPAASTKIPVLWASAARTGRPHHHCRDG